MWRTKYGGPRCAPVSKHTFWFLFVFGLLLSTALASGQSSEPSASATQPSASATQPSASAPALPSPAAAMQSPDAVVGAGDLLELSVFDVPELSKSVRVTGNGELDLPLIGKMQASGKSAAALAALIADRYRKGNLVLDPQVTIRILEFATQGITISGEVQHPGVYPDFGPKSLSDVLAQAGGMTSQADTHVQIMHRSAHTEQSVRMPLEGIRTSADENTPVYPGDSIYVPRAGIVYVLGDVTRPGGIVMRNGQLTVLEALSESQGLKQTAKLQDAFILRKQGESYARIDVPLKHYLKGEQGDLALRGGDVLVVPASGAKVFWRDTSGILASLGGAALYATAVH